MPNWKKVIISGSDAALNSLEITSHLTASGLRYPTVDGTDGQVLLTDGSGELTFSDNITYVYVKNISSGTLTKGTPVHSTGASGNTPEVIAASASLASTMPANFVLAENIATGTEGRAILSGRLPQVDTNGFSEGDNVYVAPTGSYTTTKPQGASNLIQNIAIVGSVGVNGSLFVYGSGRSNDVPNLPEGKIWVGDGYTVTSSVVHLDEPNSRLGINTNTPNQALDILGSANISGSLIIDNPSYSGTHTIRQIANSQFQFVNSGIGTYMTVGGGNAVEINSQRLKSLGRGLELDATISSTPLQVGTAGVGTGKGLTVLNSTSNYNVGIGSNTPTAKLNIVGNGTTSATTALLVEDSAGSDLLKVNDQGNVTIPNGSLSLNGATDTETFNILGNMFFDGSGVISAGGVGDSLQLQAQSTNIALGYPGASDITITGGVSGSFSGSFEGDGTNLTGITAEWDGTLNGDAEITGSVDITQDLNVGGDFTMDGDAEITGSLTVRTGEFFVSGSTVTNITPVGEVVLGYESQPVALSRNEFVLVNSGTAPVAVVDGTVFPSAHFDYVIVKGTNLRAGTVMACHDGIGNVVFTETATSDLGSTAGVALSVIETGGNLTLLMSVPSTGWYIKTFVRAI